MFLKAVMERKGFTTRVEPSIPTPAGIRRPDLVVWKEGQCSLIDVTIVADNFSLSDAHERKITYYDRPAIRRWASKESGTTEEDIVITACVLNWRGTPAARSVLELGRLGVTKADWTIISIKTLEGGARCITCFRSSTAFFGARVR